MTPPKLTLAAPSKEPEPLLDVEQAAKLLGVPVRWLYRHKNDFTFTRKLSRKCLRFDPVGLRAYIAHGRE